MIVVWQDIPEDIRVYDVPDDTVDWDRVHNKYINSDDDEEIIKLAAELEHYTPIETGPDGLSVEGQIICTGQVI